MTWPTIPLWVGLVMLVSGFLGGGSIGLVGAALLRASSRRPGRIIIDFAHGPRGWQVICADPLMVSAPLPTISKARLDAARSLVAAFAAADMQESR